MNPLRSARVILPFVRELALASYQHKELPWGAVDLGCGPDGAWLRAAKELGAVTIGVDVYPRPAGDFIDQYLQRDLRENLVDEIESQDLAICLEVAEHLPEEGARGLVKTLCDLAPFVLFSAAPPGQGPYPPVGTPIEEAGSWHINEQTPQYWALEFARLGYSQRDVIRPQFGGDMRVDPWYRTNTYLYVIEP